MASFVASAENFSMPTELGYLTIPVTSVARAKVFFEALFGWQFELGTNSQGAHTATPDCPSGFRRAGRWIMAISIFGSQISERRPQRSLCSAAARTPSRKVRRVSVRCAKTIRARYSASGNRRPVSRPDRVRARLRWAIRSQRVHRTQRWFLAFRRECERRWMGEAGRTDRSNK